MNPANVAPTDHKSLYARVQARARLLFFWGALCSTGLLSLFAADIKPHTLDQALHSADKNERLGASAAVQSGNTKATETQIIQIRDSETDPLVRHRMNQAMTGAQMTGAPAALVSSLEKDVDPMVRQGSAQQLGNYVQSPGVVEALAKALGRDKDRAVRCACALSLSLNLSPISFAALRKASTDSDPDLRRQIVYSLKRHQQGANKADATNLLEKFRHDSDASVRAAVEARP